MNHAHQLTPDLFHDLIDNRLSAIDICIKHELAIDQLAAIVESPEFTRASAQLADIERKRIEATAPLRRRAALQTLETIARQHPTTPTHTETVRKAAAQLARPPNPNPHPFRTMLIQLPAATSTQTTPRQPMAARPPAINPLTITPPNPRPAAPASHNPPMADG